MRKREREREERERKEREKREREEEKKYHKTGLETETLKVTKLGLW
jgi:hypothetical protein